MASSAAATVDEYLAELPASRAEVVGAVRDVIVEHLPAGFVETMNWGMISYEIPLERYPDTYNGRPLAGARPRRPGAPLRAVPEHRVHVAAAPAAAARGVHGGRARLDMGKSCLRFKRLADIDLDVIGELVAAVGPDDYIATYEAGRT